MAKAQKATAAQPKADKPKRKMLTPEERVARLEAELEAARNKAAEKGKVESTKLREQRSKLVTKRDDLDARIKQIDTRLAEILGDDEQVDELPLEPESTEG